MHNAIAIVIAIGAASLVISSADAKDVSVGIPKTDVAAICGSHPSGCQRCNEKNCRVYNCKKNGCTVTLKNNPAAVAPKRNGPDRTSTSAGAAAKGASGSGNSGTQGSVPGRMKK
jgi:hypothetical protein